MCVRVCGCVHGGPVGGMQVRPTEMPARELQIFNANCVMAINAIYVYMMLAINIT